MKAKITTCNPKEEKEMTRYYIKIGEFLNEENKIKYGANCNTLKEALRKAEKLTTLMGNKDYKLEITKISTKI